MVEDPRATSMDEPSLDTATWESSHLGRASALHVRCVRLEVATGPDAGAARQFSQPTVRVGTHRSCDLILTDRRVSRFQCDIVLEPRGYRVRDLGSTNGTFVSGLRINDAFVAPGTTIRMGQTELYLVPLGESVELLLAEADRFHGMVGGSAVMRRLYAAIQKVAPADTTVLITGETGVGKELVADAIHEGSPRRGKPLVVLDCGAIPAHLFEDELFGHERGAFTGALATTAGAFERAHGGTLFLDEIGELPLELQPKLLRAVESRRIRRIGGAQDLACDVRLVAATNRDLAVEVNRRTFRSDLYYRLAVARLHVPPLRERRDDIPALVDHFLSLAPRGIARPASARAAGPLRQPHLAGQRARAAQRRRARGGHARDRRGRCSSRRRRGGKLDPLHRPGPPLQGGEAPARDRVRAALPVGVAGAARLEHLGRGARGAAGPDDGVQDADAAGAREALTGSRRCRSGLAGVTE